MYSQILIFCLGWERGNSGSFLMCSSTGNVFLFYITLKKKLDLYTYKTRRFGPGRPIAPYLSLVVSTFYIRIVLFVPLVFLDSAECMRKGKASTSGVNLLNV